MALSKNDAKKKGAAKKLQVEAAHEENKKVGMKMAKEAIKKRLPAKREASKTGRMQEMQKFFRGVLAELKKVHWPNRRETAVYTSVVLVSVIFVAVLIWIFDSGLSLLLKLFL